MSDFTYSNMESIEGTVTTETTLTLTRKSRFITITNDHVTNSLTHKFNLSETVATIKPQETVEARFNTDIIIIDGDNVPYRIWVYS